MSNVIHATEKKLLQVKAEAPEQRAGSAPDVHDPYSELLLDNAERLGLRLCRDAIWHGQQCNWVGPSMEFVDARWQVVHRNLGTDMYAGTAGIALFLAELYRYRPANAIKTTAIAALNNATANRDKLLPSVKAGYYCGLIGLAHTIQKLGQQFDTDAWQARYAQIVDELLALGPDSNGVDVIMGSAGAIPALIAQYKISGNDALLQLAVQHAEQLLSHADVQATGCSWDTLNTGDQHPHLTGYAHGAAGVSMALAEMYSITREQRYADAARAGFDYENSHFDSSQKNWPDFRNLESMGISQDTKVCAVAWCHGSAGIGMSRLRSFELLKDERLKQDAHTAVGTTQSLLTQYLQAPGFDFTYCHGAIGDAELLLLADHYLEGNHHREYVCQLLKWGIETYEQHGLAWPSGVPDAGESPGLFLGTAGIGHFMLRAANPAEVSSVLLPDT